jgi:hypothetical protein
MFTTQQVTIYMSIPILAAGMVGEILNCIVFLSLKTFRENTCAFYLSIMSFVNIGQLLTSLLPRIMINGFNIDWTNTSSWYCKFRIYILEICTLMSYTCMCLATIDQFFATCFNPRWQQLSNIKLARILCLIFFFVWVLHAVPSLIYLNIILLPTTNENYCTITNLIFLNYFNYGFIITLAGFLPVIVTILFGFLAYRNVTQVAYRTVPLIRRQLEKQLSIMVFVQVVFNCFATIPFIITYILMLIPNITNDPFKYTQLLLASTVLIHMYYLHYAVSIKFIKNKNINHLNLFPFLDAILHIYVCIRTISSSINLCISRNSFKSMASTNVTFKSSITMIETKFI